MKQDQESTRNPALGLLKGHMPVSQTDIARSDITPPFLKPSDQAAFDKQAEWVESNFDQQVHPYSNSISGTVLGAIRNNAYFHRHGAHDLIETSEKMNVFFKLFISARLFISGGHSLNEYTAPFALPEVQHYFQNQGVQDFNTINLESMFYSGNETAFDAALQDTIIYNKQILQRQNMKAEIELTAQSKIPSKATLDKLNQDVENQKKDTAILALKSDKLTPLVEFSIPLQQSIQSHSIHAKEFQKKSDSLIKTLRNNHAKYVDLSKRDFISSKNSLMAKGLSKIIGHIQHFELKEAKTIITKLKATQSKTETFILLNAIETSLIDLQAVKEKLDASKNEIKQKNIAFKSRLNELQPIDDEPDSSHTIAYDSGHSLN